MMPKVPMMESGSATLGITVAQSFRRKTNITMTTSATVRISVNCTSFTDARMVSVRSARIATFTEGGSVLVSFGRSAFMRSTVSMMFAPGWRWMSSSTAGSSRSLLLTHAAELIVFHAVDHLSPISPSRTGAPFL